MGIAINQIWLDEEHTVKPNSKGEIFTVYFEGFDFDFRRGRYRIVKEVSVLEPSDKNRDEERPKVKGNVILSAEFRIE